MTDDYGLTPEQIEIALAAGKRFQKRLGAVAREFLASEADIGTVDRLAMQAIAVECLLLASFMAGPPQTVESFIDQAAAAYCQARNHENEKRARAAAGGGA